MKVECNNILSNILYTHGLHRFLTSFWQTFLNFGENLQSVMARICQCSRTMKHLAIRGSVSIAALFTVLYSRRQRRTEPSSFRSA